jgi:hypothetical protein
MMSFNEFLRNHNIPDNIQATAETVAFENANGKKFVYPLVDLERSLETLWSGGNRLDELLNHDWRYEEGKYRQALGEIFKGQKWNAVASNLGNQTPNTVRCLELYAYYRLDKKPTPNLERPEILRPESLAPIFKPAGLADEFAAWLRKKELKPKSIESYVGALAGVLSRTAGRSLLNVISVADFEKIHRSLLEHADIKKLNTTGNSMYSAALNHYASFLRDREQNGTTVAGQVDLSKFVTAFEGALTGCGFAHNSGSTSE